MAFPDEALDLRPELRVGTLDWVNVKGDAFTRDPITVTRGRADESSRPSASSCSMTLDNTTAVYSPRNPESPYYGGIGRNTPMRLSLPVDANSNYVHAIGSDISGFQSPNSAAIDNLAEDFDIMIEIDGTALIGRDQTLISRADPDTDDRSWQFGINADGTLYFWFDENGTGNTVWYGESDVPIPYLQGGTIALRATIDWNNTDAAPESPYRTLVTFWYASDLDSTWTDIGIAAIDSGGFIFDFHVGDAPLRLGRGRFFSTNPQDDGFGNALVGKIYRARFYDGWFGSGGTLVASPDFRTQGGGTTLFADAQGVFWEGTFDLVNGQAYVVDREYVYWGEVAEWPQRWEGSAGQSVNVQLQAAGVLRRITQGAAAVNSPYWRGIIHYPDRDLRAYWPCEDEANSTQFASAVPGVFPMTVTSVNKPEYAASSDLFPASEALPKIKGSTWSANLENLDWDAINGGPTTRRVGISFTMHFPTGSVLDNTVILRTADNGTIRRWDATYTTAGSGTITVRGYDSGGTVRVTVPGVAAVNDKAGQFIIEYHENGGFVFANARLRYLTSNNTSTANISQSVVQSGWLTGRPSTITINVGGGISGDAVVGNLAVNSGTITNAHGLVADVLTGNYGEAAGVRFMRLCDEEDIPVRWRGSMLDTELMGIQPIATLEEMLFECIEAENGIMFEPNDCLGLGFRTRESLYNQDVHLALDYTVSGEVMPPLEPDESDSGVSNRIKVSRNGGSSFTAQLEEGALSINPPPAGVGLYEESVSVNVRDDAQLDDQAAWRLNLGTVDDSRFPVVRINVREAPYLFGAAISTLLGDRLQIANPPKWLPPHTIDQLIQGTKTTYRPFDYSVEINCSPAAPWTVAVTDADSARADTSGSETAMSHDSTTTSLTVQTEPYKLLWVTDPAEFPFELNVGGEVVEATACLPYHWDQFTRSVSNGWGTATNGQVWTTTNGAAADYSTTGTTGRHSHPTRNVNRITSVPSLTGDSDFEITFSVVALPTGIGDHGFNVSLYSRYLGAGSNNYYEARILISSSGFGGLYLYKNVAGSVTQIAFSGIFSYTFVAGVNYHLRMACEGSLIRAKYWRDGFTEPDWIISVTDEDHFTPDRAAVVTWVGPNNTSPLPVVFTIDNFTSRNQQTFTVNRSQNGVVKPHSNGTDVRLNQPAITSF